MNAAQFTRRTLIRLGVMTPEIRAERLAQFLQTEPLNSPRRRQVEQLLQTARDRRDEAQHDC